VDDPIGALIDRTNSLFDGGDQPPDGATAQPDGQTPPNQPPSVAQPQAAVAQKPPPPRIAVPLLTPKPKKQDPIFF
jgi:hypothetical protein